MSEFVVTFNGYKLTDYLQVTTLDRGIGTERENNLQEKGLADGKDYQSYRLNEKLIAMGFALRYDLISKRRELARILNVSEPARLIFSDEPDKYYMAVPDGDISVDENNFLGFGEITWVVPDGIAHALDIKEFDNSPEEQEVTVESDFKDKVAGSVVDNASNICVGRSSILPNPNQITFEINQESYTKVSDKDNELYTYTNNVSNNQSLALISWNILEIVTRKYPELKGISVDELKKVIKSIKGNVYAKGSGPNGNKVTFARWTNSSNSWQAEKVNTSDKVILMTQSWHATTNLSYIWHENGVIPFIIYADPSDGTTPSSVSIDYASIEITLKLPNGNLVTVTNNGTYETYPTLETTMLSDNGLVAFINDRGKILQFGNPNEADGYDYQVTDKVINEAMQTQGKWVAGEGELLYKFRNGDPTTPNLKKGSWNWNNTAETIAPVFYTNETMSWAGLPINVSVPLNSNKNRDGNFEFKNRFYFITSVKTFGRLEFNAQNQEDNVVGIVVRDSSSSSANLTIEFWALGKKIYEKSVNKKQFNGKFFESSITRFGSKVTYQFSQIGSMSHEVVTPSQSIVGTYDLEAIKAVPVTSLTIWPAKFMNYEVTEIMLADTKFNWINVDKWSDLPNLFSKGDKLTVDTNSASVYLNDLEMPQIETIGNQWEGFKMSPGKTNITCIQSDWAVVPEHKVIIREAFL